MVIVILSEKNRTVFSRNDYIVSGTVIPAQAGIQPGSSHVQSKYPIPSKKMLRIRVIVFPNNFRTKIFG